MSHLRISALTILALSITMSQAAYADSFCGYDAGLIGTKAIGYIAPYAVKDITILPPSYDCTVSAYDEITNSKLVNAQPNSYSCDEFIHMPSPYVDGFAGNENNPKGFPIAASDYFAFLVFNAKDDLAQISLRSGDMKWVKVSKNKVFPYHYRGEDTKVFITDSRPTQSGIYSAPDLTSPDRLRGSFDRPIRDWILEGDIQRKFFNHPFFEYLARENKVNFETGLAEYANDINSDFAILYKVQSIHKDQDGREWLKASEYLYQALHNYDWVWESAPQEEGNNESEITSAPIRTVYFPYREPSGTITMVMTQGGYCD